MTRVLLDPGDTAWVEEPGYRPVRASLRAAGAQIVRVPVDEHGLDVHEGERRAPHARVAFVTPSYQAPLGVALSLERRLALLDWAARADAWVLEDDYNGEYRYDTDPIPAVHALDRAGRVIYIGSFSKTVAPGLRVGFLVLPPSLVEAVTRARLASDMHTPVPEQAVLAEFLSGGHFARHIRRTRDLYRQRQMDLLELAPEMTNGLLEVRPAPAGMRLLGLLPRGVDARAVSLGGVGARRARNPDVAIGAVIDDGRPRRSAARLRGVRSRSNKRGAAGAREGDRGESGGAVARRACCGNEVGDPGR